MNDESHDSADLARRASQGDPEALQTLLLRHLPALRAYVRLRAGWLVRAKETEEDLVQSVCREVLEKLDVFQHGGEAGFKRWLYATAMRKIQNRDAFYRAARRDARRERPLALRQSSPDELAAIYDSFCTPSRQLDARERMAAVESAFERLNDEEREVIVLAKIAGLSRADIGRAMGKSEGAVRTLLYRSLARLADMLAADE